MSHDPKSRTSSDISEATPIAARRAPIDLVPPSPTALVEAGPSALDVSPTRAVQRQVAQPALHALSLQRDLLTGIGAERQALQRQLSEAQSSWPDGAVQASLQRRQAARTEPSVPAAFSTPPGQGRRPPPSAADYVGLYNYEAHTLQRSSISGYVPPDRWPAIQRRAVDGLVSTYRQSVGDPVQRQASFGAQLASLQRLPHGGPMVGSVLGRLPAAERPAVQRALDEANIDLGHQAQHDAQVDQVQALQRKLAEHDALGEQALVMQRVKARQGSGEPLPEAVRRHLEQGLNANLSKVRVHTDAEADRLARQMQAQAFTTGWDIFFRKGLYDPTSAAGLKLLAHEVTHTVQQGQGRVGPGVDPDAGLEQEARQTGERLGDLAARPSSQSALPGQSFRPAPGNLALAVQRRQAEPDGKPKSTPKPAGQTVTVKLDTKRLSALSPAQRAHEAKVEYLMQFGRQRGTPELQGNRERAERYLATHPTEFRGPWLPTAEELKQGRIRVTINPGSAQVSQAGAGSQATRTLTTQADGMAQPKPGINATGFIEYKDEGANLRSGPAELPGSRTLTTQPLPNTTRVYVSGQHPQKPEWLYVTALLSGGMVRGYVQNFRVNTQLPEPTATLHEINDGDQLRPLSGRIYHQDVQPGRDLRFYEEAVLYMNGQAGRNGVYRGGDGSVHLMRGKRIWLVSPAFANTLQGKVASGSITGGLVAQAKEASRHLQDVLAAVNEFPTHFGEVAGEYAAAIWEHRAQILSVLALFVTGEAASALLASSPTGVGQLAAAAIQLGLAVWGAKGAVEAAAGALPHAEAWLTTAWKANGDAAMIAEAAKSVGRMVVQIALAAMALLGAKGNWGKGLKLADGVKITPPSFQVMQTAGGPGVAIPVFHPGSIEAVGAATTGGPSLMTGLGRAGNEAKLNTEPNGETPQGEEPAPLSNRELTPEQAEALLQKTKNWDQLKEYVGKPANPADPPPGYFYRTKNGTLELVRKNAQSGDYAPLTVKDGLVVLKSGGSNRISIFSRYKGNYLKWLEDTQGKAARTAAEGRLAGGNQLHHLIPDAVAQASPLVREALARVKGYTIDRGTNILDMPVVRNAADDIVHHGSHPLFNTWVKGRLDRALEQVTRDGEIPLNQVQPTAIDQALHGVENFIRNAIKNKTVPPEVLKELEAGGMKLSYVPQQQESTFA